LNRGSIPQRSGEVRRLKIIAGLLVWFGCGYVGAAEWAGDIYIYIYMHSLDVMASKQSSVRHGPLCSILRWGHSEW
jgi:hypothetical protein